MLLIEKVSSDICGSIVEWSALAKLSAGISIGFHSERPKASLSDE